ALRLPAKSYCVFGPAGVDGGFAGHPRRTTQEFQMDDDLGDSQANSLGYGGKLNRVSARNAGAIWVAKDSLVKLWVYADSPRKVNLQILKPDNSGKKSNAIGPNKDGQATATTPLHLEFQSDAEGYFQLTGQLIGDSAEPVRSYFK